MNEKETYTIKSPVMSRLEASYLWEIFKGMLITLRHGLGSIWRGRYSRTIQYPEERRENIPVLDGGMEISNYRGFHRLNRDQQGRVKCVACFLCATNCPVDCIHIEAEASPWPDREKYPAKFDIDELRCIYCGMCEEACPEDAIELTPEYDIVGQSRQEMIFDKQKLLSLYDNTVEKKPM